MSGLEGVVAAETVLSHVDGEAGRLVIRGHDLEGLAGRMSYERALAVLWEGLIDVGKANELPRVIGEARERAFADFTPLFAHAATLDAFSAMRFLMASIGDGGPLAGPAGQVGAMAVAAAAATRLTAGAEPIPPDREAAHAGDLLRMATGQLRSPAEISALDTYLVTVIDHGLNASTFTARVVASTGADYGSAVLAALGALRGPLHGGAPGPVLDMLDAIGSAGNAVPWLEAALDRKERLMGFGHRIYRTRDPRADVLKRALGRMDGRGARLVLAEYVERTALDLLARRKAGRRLDVNVEFYTALLLDGIGLPREAFTPVFACGRVGGWLAHCAEQAADGRLIRPQSRYVGPMPGKAA
ncbi:MAG TPA: citrate synthase [Devosiaceae bacterium]